MKKFFFSSFFLQLLICLCLIIFFAVSYESAQNWVSQVVSSQIEAQAQKRNIRWQSEGVVFSPFKLRVQAEEVELYPTYKNGAVKGDWRVKAKNLYIHPDWRMLLRLNLTFKVGISDAELFLGPQVVQFKKGGNNNNPTPLLEQIFEKSKLTLLSHAELQNVRVVLSEPTLAAWKSALNLKSGVIDNLFASQFILETPFFELKKRSLGSGINIMLEEALFKSRQLPHSDPFALSFHILLKRKAIQVRQFYLSNSRSYFDWKSTIELLDGKPFLLSGGLRSHFFIEDMVHQAGQLRLFCRPPLLCNRVAGFSKAYGKVDFEIESVQYQFPGFGETSSALNGLSAKITLSAKHTMWNKTLGFSNAQLEGRIKDGVLHFGNSLLSMSRPAGWNVHLLEGSLELASPFAFKVHTSLGEKQPALLGSLFQVLNIESKAPVQAQIQGDTFCDGALRPKLSLDCKGGEQHVKELLVTNQKRTKSILMVPALHLRTRWGIDDKKNWYLNTSVFNKQKQNSSNLVDKESASGESNVVDTKIQFSRASLGKSNGLHFRFSGQINGKDIGHLIEQPLKGNVFVHDGHLRIQNSQVRITSGLSLETFSFGKFYLSDFLTTQFEYDGKGSLNFNNIEGHVNNTRLSGNVSINILKHSIFTNTLLSPLDMRDLNRSLSDAINVPLTLEGVGEARVRLNIPFRKNKLKSMHGSIESNMTSLHMENEFFSEKFKQVAMNIDVKDGEIHFKKFQLFYQDVDSYFELGGRVFSTPALDLVWSARLKGRKLDLQSIKTLKRGLGLDVVGKVDFDFDISRGLTNPLVNGNVKIRDLHYRNISFGSQSDFTMNLDFLKSIMELEGQTSANQIQIQRLTVPFRKNKSPGNKNILVEIRTQDLDLKNFRSTSFFTKYNRVSSLTSNIDSTIKISYPLREGKALFHNLRAVVQVDRLSLKTHGLVLKNESPFRLQLNGRDFQTEPFALNAKNSSLKLFGVADGGVKVEGSTRLEFFSFLLPFIRDMEGDLTFKNFTFYPWHILTKKEGFLKSKGDIELRDLSLDIHPRIDPLDEGSAFLRFDGESMYFNRIMARSGRGDLSGNGFIRSRGVGGCCIIDIQGSVKDYSFQALSGIYALGSGSWRFYGDKAPFTFFVGAKVREASIEKEFSGGGGGIEEIETELSSLKDENEVLFFKNYKSKKQIPVIWDLQLTFKNPVKMTNSMMTALAHIPGGLNIKGPLSRDILLKGTLHLEGDIFHRDHEFRIQSASVDYDNVRFFEPKVDLSARTVIYEQHADRNFEEEHEVDLILKGRGKQFSMDLKSASGISRNEIISLLVFGVRASSVGENQSVGVDNKLVQYSYHQLGPMLFQKSLSKEMKKNLKVDGFNVIPTFDEQNNQAVTKFELTKNVFKNVDLSGSRTIMDIHPETQLKAEVALSSKVSAVGFWKNEKPVDGTDKLPNTFGLDLEYKIDF